ncbi:MAG: transposase [Flavobacteriales bacterium]|nr:transposase [Flavobacteriales bacterium]
MLVILLLFAKQTHTFREKASRIRASKQVYQSTHQLNFPGFESPFAQQLNAHNRRYVLANKIPSGQIVCVYDKRMHNNVTGAGHINGRVILGALMIKHMCNLSDEETVLQIQENMYMQYFIGYFSFSNEPPFDSSLFVEIRKRLGLDEISAINERMVELSVARNVEKQELDKTDPDSNSD